MGEGLKRTVVFSAVNFVEGGPLSILKDAINAFLLDKTASYDLIIIVHDKALFKEFDNHDISFVEKKNTKSSYLRRFWFEYVSCYFISKKIKPFLWLALHDMTPNVKSVIQVVYCHNPGPFYKASLKEAKADPTFFLFTIFYKLVYRLNLKKNNFVIVQQDWMRQYFIKQFHIKSVIVAHPNILKPLVEYNRNISSNQKFTFFYPAFPRVFKNFETLLKAVAILNKHRSDFSTIVTINGSENGYATDILKKFGHLRNVSFIGFQPREEILRLYASVDCLVFPSKLETWGLPISEFKFFKKPMLIADGLYARETVGEYNQAKLFTTDDASELACYMNAAIDGTIEFEKIKYSQPAAPFSKNWNELLNILLP